jgi:Cu/Ag efflux pump CusA
LGSLKPIIFGTIIITISFICLLLFTLQKCKFQLILDCLQPDYLSLVLQPWTSSYLLLRENISAYL